MGDAFDDYVNDMEGLELEREAHFEVALRHTVWHTDDGRILEVSEMTPSHARNARAWMLRRYPHMKKRIKKSVLGKALKARGKEQRELGAPWE